jgi:hypothetical protein
MGGVKSGKAHWLTGNAAAAIVVARNQLRREYVVVIGVEALR